ncbi:MAG TPA: pantoate--beta-alanine ligase [Methylophilaceae bacterium]|nr:pantoate--beta-alanine ligase [Methylophilaceae bacterium]
MQLIHTVAELRQRLSSETSISFVPTMGNLHAGHLHLVKLARQHGQCVVVSIFVNPLQFGVNEDLANYPRTLHEDCAKLEAAEADIVFAPSESEMYPVPQTMMVAPPPIANDLCGASRPGHFSGVATVVLKLFNLVQPHVAVFGKKDAQQLFIIRELIRQFNLGIDIVAGETIREADGLAMSSRNGYLSSEERAKAPQLYRTLQQVVEAVEAGRKDYAETEAHAAASLRKMGWDVDYISVRSSRSLLEPTDSEKNLLVLGAARLGNTRLIDNIECEAS